MRSIKIFSLSSLSALWQYLFPQHFFPGYISAHKQGRARKVVPIQIHIEDYDEFIWVLLSCCRCCLFPVNLWNIYKAQKDVVERKGCKYLWQVDQVVSKWVPFKLDILCSCPHTFSQISHEHFFVTDIRNLRFWTNVMLILYVSYRNFSCSIALTIKQCLFDNI